jgi:hypothetical protein
MDDRVPIPCQFYWSLCTCAPKKGMSPTLFSIMFLPIYCMEANVFLSA